tara:strand:- start:2837 stop:3055 length:219 start_codon:yes stop_codon:yes gene_type:complete
MVKNDLYGKDIREIQVEIYRKTNKLYKKVLELDHGSLRNYLLSDIEEIQKDHSIVENFLITTLWLEEESKKQ